MLNVIIAFAVVAGGYYLMITLIDRGIRIDGGVDLVRGTKDQPAPARLKIPTDCPKTCRDFIVDLECPDGTSARVLIPLDAGSYEGRCSRVYNKLYHPVGLNLVCPGHYT